MFATDTVLVEPQDEVGLFKVKVADDLFWDNQLLKLDLQGTYQGKNVAGVLCSILALKSGWSLEDVAIKRGIENASRNTGLQGRWMCLQENPYVFADIAHNEAGIQEVVRSLGNYQFDKLHIVFGAVQDKEVAKVLQLLPAYAKFHCCSPKLPRAMSLEMLMENMMNATKESIAYSSVKEAYEGALAVAAPRDFVLVCGSNFVVAEVLESLTGV
jgi:dihydrofolate synthase/folylpolyglutamate synthase